MLLLLISSVCTSRRVVLLALPKVDLEHVGQHESLPAVVADIRPLSVVGLSVDTDVPGRGEALLADLARVALLVGVCRRL